MQESDGKISSLGANMLGGGVLILLWLITLITVIVLRSQLAYDSHKELHWFETFYRTGSLIFGGGQVGREGMGLGGVGQGRVGWGWAAAAR